MDFFLEIANNDENGPIADSAKRYLHRLREKKAEKKKFFVYLQSGIEYDSNVILQPSAPVITGAKEADWLLFFTAEFDWKFLRTKRAVASVGYELYQSFYSSLDQFNVNENQFEFGSDIRISKKVEADLDYSFSYTIIGGETYSKIHKIRPKIQFFLSSDLLTELHYTHKFRDFSDTEEFPRNSEFAGGQDDIGIRQYVDLSENISMYADLTYRNRSTRDDFRDYSGLRGKLGLNMIFNFCRVYLRASYFDRNYRADHPNLPGKRKDEVQTYSLYISKNITENITFNISEYYVNNNSNLPTSDYRRNIAGFFLEVRL